MSSAIPTESFRWALQRIRYITLYIIIHSLLFRFAIFFIHKYHLLRFFIPQLSFDLLESWLAENPDAAGFKRDGESIFRELALFQDYHGLPAFKNVSMQLQLIHMYMYVLCWTGSDVECVINIAGAGTIHVGNPREQGDV